jgi:hypothetical protein
MVVSVSVSLHALANLRLCDMQKLHAADTLKRMYRFEVNRPSPGSEALLPLRLLSCCPSEAWGLTEGAALGLISLAATVLASRQT